MTTALVVTHPARAGFATTPQTLFFPLITGRHLLHGKISLDADGIEITTLLGRSPAAIGASLRLLVSKAKVRHDRVYISDTLSRLSDFRRLKNIGGNLVRKATRRSCQSVARFMLITGGYHGIFYGQIRRKLKAAGILPISAEKTGETCTAALATVRLLSCFMRYLGGVHPGTFGPEAAARTTFYSCRPPRGGAKSGRCR